MRPALFLSALLATALFGGTALAERTSDDSYSRRISSAQDLKERVLHERGESRSVERASTRVDHASARVEKFRAKGENYEQYGHRSSGAVSTAASHSASSKMLMQKVMPTRSHGDIVDGQSKSSRTSGGSVALSTAPGAKNAKSFVHMVNDKGELNNSIRGGTATAMKMRHVAKIIMQTAVQNPHIKVFSWTSAGGDGQALSPGN